MSCCLRRGRFLICREQIGMKAQVNAWLFSIDEAEIRLVYFKFLAAYKAAIILFNLIPYLALAIAH